MTSRIVSGTIFSDEDSSSVGRDGYFMRNSGANGQSSYFQPDLQIEEGNATPQSVRYHQRSGRLRVHFGPAAKQHNREDR